MNNQDYVRSLGVDVAAQRRCLDVMAKYGDNHWWESGVDERTFAYYQMLEPVMLVRGFDRFHAAVEKLLGRPVWTHEFGVSHDELCQEAERAYHGERDGAEQRRANIASGMRALVEARPDAVYLVLSDEVGQ